MTATIHDLTAKREQTKFMPVKHTGMTPHQWGVRQTMERGGWTFKKVSKMDDVVMEFGSPVAKMAFIEPTGHVETYKMGE